MTGMDWYDPAFDTSWNDEQYNAAYEEWVADEIAEGVDAAELTMENYDLHLSEKAEAAAEAAAENRAENEYRASHPY